MSLVIPTACARNTDIRGGMPFEGPEQRCDLCGHPFVNHVFGEYCELCQFEVRLQQLEEQG